MEVFEKIRFIRMFKGWSQEETAERLQMTLNGYTKIENGKVDVSLSRLKQIAETFEIELAQLFGLNDKNIFNFIENYNSSILNSHHPQHSTVHITNQLEDQHELEKARLIIENQEKEIVYLKEIIELLKIQRSP